MRLDRTRIAIIERRQPEILDAALLVLRKFFLPVTGLVLLVALPLSMLNHWLIAWSASDNIELASRLRYSWLMLMLIYLEAPFVSSLATAYIGKVMFYEDPTTWELVKSTGKLMHRLLWVHGVLRGFLIAIIVLALTTPSEELTPAEVLLPIICFIAFIVRSIRPYISEILILELSPLKTVSQSAEASAGVRSARLHSPHAGDLFGRSVAMVLVSICLAFAVLAAIWFFCCYSHKCMGVEYADEPVCPAVFDVAACCLHDCVSLPELLGLAY